jgi:hypothetical protein
LNDINPNIQILQENEHTHEEDDDLIGKNEALNQMKDAIFVLKFALHSFLQQHQK